MSKKERTSWNSRFRKWWKNLRSCRCMKASRNAGPEEEDGRLLDTSTGAVVASDSGVPNGTPVVTTNYGVPNKDCVVATPESPVVALNESISSEAPLLKDDPPEMAEAVNSADTDAELTKANVPRCEIEVSNTDESPSTRSPDKPTQSIIPSQSDIFKVTAASHGVKDITPNVIGVEETQDGSQVTAASCVSKDITPNVIGVEEMTQDGGEGKKITPVLARVIYSYTAKNENELSLRPCEVITIRRKVDESWMEGEWQGNCGLFPSDYVTLIDSDTIQGTTSQDSAEEEGSVEGEDSGEEEDSIGTVDVNDCPPTPVGNAIQDTNEVNNGNTESTTGGGNVPLPDSETSIEGENEETMVAGDYINPSGPTNQWESKDCTCHAMAKALAARFDIDPDTAADCLNQKFINLNGTFPTEFNGQLIKIITTKYHVSILITVIVEECKVPQTCDNENYVLVYKEAKYPHCVYVKERNEKEQTFVCINSWGNVKPVFPVAFDDVQHIYKVDGRYKPENALLEPRIKVLSYDEIKKISSLLDILGTVNNWYNLGRRLGEKYPDLKIKREEIEDLRRNYCGGGSCASVLLQRISLKNPDYLLAQLSEIAKNLERIDIVNIISKWPVDQKLLSGITDEQQTELERALNRKAYVNWRDFADRMGFSMDDIKKIEESLVAGERYSPCEELFQIIRTRNESFLLCDIRSLLQDIGRNDVVEIIKPIIEKYKRLMIYKS